MADDAEHIYEFGPFQLRAQQRLLFNAGQQVALTPKSLQLLLMLVENRGQLVEKAELLATLWPNSCVEDAVLAQNIFTLRKQLGEHPDGGEYIQTIPRRGYRFVAAVNVHSGDPARALPSDGAPPRRSAGRRMIVVLPVQNLTGNPDLEYLADGFTEAIIGRLGTLEPGAIGVIARTSSMAYKNSRKTLREIATELGVDYALEGSVRRCDERIVLSMQLVQAAEQSHLRTMSYERPLDDVLKVQSEIAGAVADEISLVLSPLKQQQLSATRTVRPVAYEYFLKGRYHWNQRTQEGLRAAIGFFERSIAEDPTFAPAYSGLAECWTFRALYGPYAPRDAFPRARAAAATAIQLDEGNAEAHSMLALTLGWFEYDWAGAEREFRRAIALEPDNAFVRNWYATYLALLAHHEHALEQIHAARRCDPLSIVVQMTYGLVLDVSRRNELALEIQQDVLQRAPGLYFNQTVLGHNCCKLGRFEEGIEHLQRAYERSGRQPDMLAHLGCALAAAGRHAQAHDILARIRECDGHVSPYYIARVHAGLGDFDAATECLWRAYDERAVALVSLPVDNWLMPAANHPRYIELLQRIAFPASPM